MARARNIKPALFKNELLGVADPHLTLLFISLWTLADKEGRIEDRPLRIKAETFPYREGLDVNGYLTELQRLGFIVRYVVDQQALIQVVNFKKHQTPHNTEKPSELPSLESATVDITDVQSAYVNSPLNNRENVNALPPDSLLLITDSLIPDYLNLIPEKHSSPSGSKPTREKSITEIELLKNYSVEGQLAKDFLKIRKAKRAPITETALKGIYDEANKAGIDFNHAIRICIERNWQGFKADWDWKPKQPENKKPSRMSLEGIDYQEGVNADGSI